MDEAFVGAEEHVQLLRRSLKLRVGGRLLRIVYPNQVFVGGIGHQFGFVVQHIADRQAGSPIDLFATGPVDEVGAFSGVAGRQHGLCYSAIISEQAVCGYVKTLRTGDAGRSGRRSIGGCPGENFAAVRDKELACNTAFGNILAIGNGPEAGSVVAEKASAVINCRVASLVDDQRIASGVCCQLVALDVARPVRAL
ncbi:hypothetical protein D9M68_761260 [compost metagenome]